MRDNGRSKGEGNEALVPMYACICVRVKSRGARGMRNEGQALNVFMPGKDNKGAR